MTIKVGDRLPAGTLWEFIDEETEGCSLGPNSFDVEKIAAGKRVAIGYGAVPESHLTHG